MIVKIGRPRQTGKGNFADLARYAVERDNHFVDFINIGAAIEKEDLEVAIAVVENTQLANVRSKVDKNIHLIVSFRAGEYPTKEQLSDIVRYQLKALGLTEHQAIAALHRDTDNWHLHIVINKIHPVTFNCIDPFQSKMKLDFAARELELKHGLSFDNGIHMITSQGEIVKDPAWEGRRGLTERATDFETVTGIESFQSWAKRIVTPELLDALNDNKTSWQDLHEIAARYNVTIKKSGAGFSLVDRDNSEKYKTKLSTIGINKIEKRLGEYRNDLVLERKKSDNYYLELPIENDVDYTSNIGAVTIADIEKNLNAAARKLQLIGPVDSLTQEAIRANIKNLRSTLGLSEVDATHVLSESEYIESIKLSLSKAGSKLDGVQMDSDFADTARSRLEHLRNSVDTERATIHAKRREERAALYATYLKAKTEYQLDRKALNSELAKVRQLQKAKRTAIFEKHKLDKAAIKSGKLGRDEKKAALSILAAEQADAMMQFNKLAEEERNALKDRFIVDNPGTYASYLMSEAAGGNEVALLAIRGMKNTVVSNDKKAAIGTQQIQFNHEFYRHAALAHKTHRSGEVSYFKGKSEILRDEGRRIMILDPLNTDSIELALRMAKNKFGKEVTVTPPADGADQFIKKVVQIAVDQNLGVTFADPNMEAYRRELEAQKLVKRQTAFVKPEPLPPVDKVVFDVPFKDRHDAVDIGLKWDNALKGYACEAGSVADTNARKHWQARAEETPIVTAVPDVTLPNELADHYFVYMAERNKLLENKAVGKASDLHEHVVMEYADLYGVDDIEFKGQRAIAKAGVYDAALFNAVVKGQKQTLIVPMNNQLMNQIKANKVKPGDKLKFIKSETEKRLQLEVINKAKERGMSR